MSPVRWYDEALCFRDIGIEPPTTKARPPFDRECAEVQLDYLVRHQKLLTAVEAAAIAKKNGKNWVRPGIQNGEMR